MTLLGIYNVYALPTTWVQFNQYSLVFVAAVCTIIFQHSTSILLYFDCLHDSAFHRNCWTCFCVLKSDVMKIFFFLIFLKLKKIKKKKKKKKKKKQTNKQTDSSCFIYRYVVCCFFFFFFENNNNKKVSSIFRIRNFMSYDAHSSGPVIWETWYILLYLTNKCMVLYLPNKLQCKLSRYSCKADLSQGIIFQKDQGCVTQILILSQFTELLLPTGQKEDQPTFFILQGGWEAGTSSATAWLFDSSLWKTHLNQTIQRCVTSHITYRQSTNHSKCFKPV